MSREGKIVKNIIVYSIGNFGSKILAYIMVLVYTHYITASELGYYDIVLMTISLLQPFVLMMFDDGIYRWMIDDDQDNKTLIISTCLKTIFVTTGLSIVIFLLLGLHFSFPYTIGIALYMGTSMLYQMLLNTVRGLGNSKLYAISGIINSLFLLIFEVGGLIFLQLGLGALIYSKVLSNIITLVYIYINQKELYGVFKYKYNVPLAKAIFKYSAPIIPNNICWWVVNSSDRYIILFFLGAASNGIYSLANKFPTVVTTITGILYIALQESFIKEYNGPDRDEFYSNIFKKYYTLLFSLIICGIPATKVVVELFVSTEYKLAWQYTGFLYLSTVFSALSVLLGLGYQISRETKRSIMSTIFAAVINFGVNIVFVNLIGLHAASFSTMIAYVFLLIIRLHHCRKYFILKINWLDFMSLLGISVLMIGITFIPKSLVISFVATLCGMGITVIKNREIVIPIIRKIFKRG